MSAPLSSPSLSPRVAVRVRVSLGVGIGLVYLVLEYDFLGRRGLDHVTKHCVLIGPHLS